MTSLSLCEIILAVTYIIAAFVAYEFIRLKDGELRIIMIGYFTAEFMIYFSGAAYLMSWEGVVPNEVVVFIACLITPKMIIKIWLLDWLVKGRRKKK
jgi:biotin transporter BioY